MTVAVVAALGLVALPSCYELKVAKGIDMLKRWRWRRGEEDTESQPGLSVSKSCREKCS